MGEVQSTSETVEYYKIGKAMSMLKVRHRAIVSLCDRGILKYKIDPITGHRLIEKGSIERRILNKARLIQ
jgi:hypothetical protein